VVSIRSRVISYVIPNLRSKIVFFPFSDSCSVSRDEILLRGLVVTPLVLRVYLAPRLRPEKN
jgi:hypothetical protein